MTEKYWLSILPCGCLEAIQLDDGSILPPGTVNEFVKQAVTAGNRTELQECQEGEYPYRACELHRQQNWPVMDGATKEVEMVTKLITKDGDAIPLTTEKPKRTRRPKGNVTIQTFREATVHVAIPFRPVGMQRVTISLLVINRTEDSIRYEIEWPDGMTALDAITAFLIRPAK